MTSPRARKGSPPVHISQVSALQDFSTVPALCSQHLGVEPPTPYFVCELTVRTEGAGWGKTKQQRLAGWRQARQPHAETEASCPPLGPEGRRRELWLGDKGEPGHCPSPQAHTRLRGLLVSHMDDGGAEATLTGDGHHTLRLIGQGERAQGASHHGLLPRGGPLPRQHCRLICAERWHQLPPLAPTRKSGEKNPREEGRDGR